MNAAAAAAGSDRSSSNSSSTSKQRDMLCKCVCFSLCPGQYTPEPQLESVELEATSSSSS